MKASVGKILVNDEVVHEVGTVASISDEDIVVRCGRGTFHARRAVSCLTAPEAGDSVLFAGSQAGGLFVIAILERPSGATTRIEASGDVTLAVSHGRLVLAAARGVDVVSSGDVSLASTRMLKLSAPQSKLLIGSLSYLGQKLSAEVEQVTSLFGALETIAERVLQRVKRSYRFVDELDQLKAKDIDYSARENVRLRGHNTLVTADQIAKVDADQIHLG